MKWLPFFILLSFFSCKSEKKQPVQEKIKEQAIPDKVFTITNQVYELPYETENDTGYFKGYASQKLETIEDKDTTMLYRFLSNIISKKDIVLLDSETLSHSAFINQQTKTRFDTLRNKNTIITSVYHFAEPESQTIKLNGTVIKSYNWKGVDSLREDIIDMNGNSFRHFSFKGKEFYYIAARIMDGHYGSIHTITYHLIYNAKAKSPDMFMTCRFGQMLFGDADGDENLDYLDFNNSDFCTGVPYSDNVTIELNSCNQMGDFVLQKDKKGTPYFIDGKTGEGFAQDSFNVKRHYWPVPIK
jgi:hypothetical protein